MYCLPHKVSLPITLADLEGGLRGGGLQPPPPFKFQKKKREKKQKKKKKKTLLKMKNREKLHVCLVFMCTRVDTCINKHFFSSKLSS